MSLLDYPLESLRILTFHSYTFLDTTFDPFVDPAFHPFRVDPTKDPFLDSTKDPFEDPSKDLFVSLMVDPDTS